jgi:hypothetical protein
LRDSGINVAGRTAAIAGYKPTTPYPNPGLPGATPPPAAAAAGEEIAVGAGTTAAAGVGAAAVGAGAAIAGGALLAVGGIVAGVVAWKFIGDDNNTHEAYTQHYVQQASQQLPNYNIVICHPQHKVTGQQVQHAHVEVAMHVGTCGYDAYASPMGQPFVFENQGDGGYLN